MATHIHNESVNDGIDVVSKTTTKTNEGVVHLDTVIPPNSVDLEVEVAFPAGLISSLVLLATATMTVKTNDGAAPDQTFDMIADKPIKWKEEDFADNPIEVDVTKFYVTSVAGGILRTRVLYDSTA